MTDRWSNFEAFLSDVGRRPSSLHTLDRIDVNGNYDVGNVRWATPEEQSQNRRSTKLSAEKVREIRAMLRAGDTQQDVADRFGVTSSLISMIATRRIWKNVKD